MIEWKRDNIMRHQKWEWENGMNPKDNKEPKVTPYVHTWVSLSS
jgi:hypothetical protein